MKKLTFSISLMLFSSLALPADDSPWQRLARPYAPRPVPPVDLSNSPRLDQVLRAGNIYLSLTDAIALAIENNLDVELQRYNMPTADSEVLRAKGGGLLRGFSYNLAEVPVGVGGPASPLVTSAASSTVAVGSVPTNPSELGVLAEQQTNLSILGNLPLSNGPAIPQFDPAITAQVNWMHQSAPQSSPGTTGVNVLNSDTTWANVGYSQGFGPGTQLTAGFDNMRQTLNSTSSAYSPFTASSFGVTVTQPLVRGFGLAVNRRFIRIAKNERKIADLLLRQQLIATVYGVVRLYTDLVALFEDVKVKEDTLAAAEKLYSDTKAQVDEGTQAQIELTRANAQVFSIRQDLINSRGLLEEQEAIVKSVITRRSASRPEVLNARIVPTDSLNMPEKDDLAPLQDLLAQAFQSRPDLKQAGVQVENSQISLQGSRNALLPELDLVGMAQNSGLAGQQSAVGPVADPNFLGGYGNALEQLAAVKYPTYEIGIQLTLPLRNRVAQADVARDEIQTRQTEIRLQQLRNQAQLEVEDALVAMRKARSSYEAALQTQALQKESLEAEQSKFQVGASTSFFIIQYESYLSQARSTVVVAKGAYLKAQAALQRAVGTILDDHQVSIDQAIRGR
jgi:outer membrane protein